VHERAEPLAALYASEAPIYGRFGYGVATYQALIEVEGSHSAFRSPVSAKGQTVMVDVPTAVETFTRISDKARPAQPGMVSMDERWWRMVLADPERDRGGASPLYRVVYQGADGSEGFVLYRIKMSWSSSEEPNGEVRLQFLIALTPEAYAALWRYLLEIDLITRLTSTMRPPEEPLRFLLLDSRQPRTTIFDGLWLRLVDVPSALASRGYGREGHLVLRVRDNLCPWNDGVYALEAGAGRAQCRPTSASPDLEISAADLASVYLGGNRPSMLWQAGRITEHRSGAVADANAMFASEMVPWCPTHF
jgi:predicted acetyltransferase